MCNRFQKLICLVSLVFVMGLVGNVSANTEYTYTIYSSLGASTCSGLDPGACELGYPSVGVSFYIGDYWRGSCSGAGATDDITSWFKFDVNDFSAMTPPQTISSVVLRGGRSARNASHPFDGIRVDRISDDSWTTGDIHNAWPVSSDWVILSPQGAETEGGDGFYYKDITSWWGVGKEPLSGGEVFSARYTANVLGGQGAQQLSKSWQMLTITTILVGMATSPNPADDANNAETDVVLSWTPGLGATSHEVYFGTDYNDVNDAGIGSPEHIGQQGSNSWDSNNYDSNGLELARTYYWRIDENSGAGISEGSVWQFTVRPLTIIAWDPCLADGEWVVEHESALNWMPGDYAVLHDVYFGTSFEDVNNAGRLAGDADGNGWVDLGDVASVTAHWLGEPPEGPGPLADLNGDGNVDLLDFAIVAADLYKRGDDEFVGRYGLDSNSYNPCDDPCCLPLGTYYWRVDEVNEEHPDKLWKGDIWKFKVTKGLSRGHVLLIEKGLQIKGLIYPQNTGSFDLNHWDQSNYTTADIWQGSGGYLSYLGPPPGVPWSRVIVNIRSFTETEQLYASNLVSLQFGDEQDKDGFNQDEIGQAAIALANWRRELPDVIGHTNQLMYGASDTVMRDYKQQAQPDMLMLGIYVFNVYIPNADLTNMYYRFQRYRLLGNEGNDGTGDKPIPYAYYQQTFEHRSEYYRTPSDSELRLSQFAPWTFGHKFIGCFVYEDVGLPVMSIYATLFNSPGDTNPRPHFDWMAETVRQGRNLGPALVRLLSTNIYMIDNHHDLPSNVSSWSSSADPYITSITATNLGSFNNGNPGDVLVGYFQPLHESFDGPDYEDQTYFMIFNGLCDGEALVSETSQRIDITFDFGGSGITSLQRLSRDTGKVEVVPLIPLGGSDYKLELTLPGGTGDLFKFNTGAPFVKSSSPSLHATHPIPGDIAKNAAAYTNLSWEADFSHNSHDVYFGTNRVLDVSEFMGNQTSTSYQPPETLRVGTTYYWCIDEVDPEEQVTEGDVWSFTTWNTMPPR